MFFWDGEYDDVRLASRLAAFEGPEPCEYGPDVYGELDESYLEDLGSVEVDLSAIRGSAIKTEWPSIDEDACQHFLTLWTDGEWDPERETISVLEVNGDYWVSDGHSRYVVKNAVNPEGTIMANVKRRIPVEAGVQGPSGQDFATMGAAQRRSAEFVVGEYWLTPDGEEGYRVIDVPNATGESGTLRGLATDQVIEKTLDEMENEGWRRVGSARRMRGQYQPGAIVDWHGDRGVINRMLEDDIVEVRMSDSNEVFLIETPYLTVIGQQRVAGDDIGVGTVIHHLATGKSWTITGFDPTTDYWLTDQGPAWTNDQLRNNIMKGIYRVEDAGGMATAQRAGRQAMQQESMESFSCNDRIRESATGRCGEIMALDETGEFGDISWDDGEMEENVGLLPGQFTKYGDDEPRLFDPRPAGRHPRRRVLDRPVMGPTVVAATPRSTAFEDHAVVNLQPGQRVLVASIDDLGLPSVEATLERIDPDGWAIVRTAEGRDEVPVEALRKKEAGWDEKTRYPDVPINPGDRFQLYSGGDRYLTVVAVDPFTGSEDDTVTLDDSDGGVTVEPRGYLEDRIHEGIWKPVNDVDTSYVDWMAQARRRRVSESVPPLEATCPKCGGQYQEIVEGQPSCADCGYTPKQGFEQVTEDDED